MTCGAKARVTFRDDCMTCFFCELRCPSEAIDVHPFKERLPYTIESNTRILAMPKPMCILPTF